MENGFFILFPNATTKLKLAPISQNPHISILVINDQEEILKLKSLFRALEEEGCYEVSLDFGKLKFFIKDYGKLTMRNGKKVNVAHVNFDTSLKRELQQKYNLKSDIYGQDQKFHITLDDDIYISVKQFEEEELIFDKCIFSVRKIVL